MTPAWIYDHRRLIANQAADASYQVGRQSRRIDAL